MALKHREGNRGNQVSECSSMQSATRKLKNWVPELKFRSSPRHVCVGKYKPYQTWRGSFDQPAGQSSAGCSPSNQPGDFPNTGALPAGRYWYCSVNVKARNRGGAPTGVQTPHNEPR